MRARAHTHMVLVSVVIPSSRCPCPALAVSVTRSPLSPLGVVDGARLQVGEGGKRWERGDFISILYM
ncbi:hypothetical protein SORBI_3008G176100 [Sorghum bicolor]|jgi:hypothetical protein|uniref:Uncharacterized protein n=1 Tax=Sorghum bicolor TaxID=4558 RepID=A0A1B6PES4_SORBI|nr:hypothetical protein SORBI_3008G176100 [Sorghum bicolor]